MPPLPPAPAIVEQTPLLDQVRQLLEVAPRLAFEKAALLRDPLLRDRERRDAFLALARAHPDQAAALLPQVMEARWIGRVHFAQALDIAWFTVRDQPALSRRFLLASALRHPAAALREQRQYVDLPYGPAVREAAQAAAAGPDPGLLLLQIRQNPALAATLAPVAILRLAVAAATEEERVTASALLRNLDWDPMEDPALLRGALALLAEMGLPCAAPASVFRRALTGIDDAEDPLAEAVKAASFLALAPPGVEDALPATPLGRLLAAQRTVPAPQTTLAVDELFPDGLCLQRYVFHNDDDGVESFESFLAAYANDPNWAIERSTALVHLTGRLTSRRRIEIFANIPVDLQLPANAARTAEVRARQAAVTRALPGPPSVLVHRGHDHHFPDTRPFLRNDARLVFLGSCYGMSNVEDVVTRCRRAQMIATRGIGATAVNDTFLRALNRRLLGEESALDWDEFWSTLRPVLGGSEHFQAYVPPNRNGAARFLAAWYRQALSAP